MHLVHLATANYGGTIWHCHMLLLSLCPTIPRGHRLRCAGFGQWRLCRCCFALFITFTSALLYCNCADFLRRGLRV
jgi:hypothetical protein